MNWSWAGWKADASVTDCSERGMLAGCKAAGPGCPEAYPVRYAEDKRDRERSSRTTGPLRAKDLRETRARPFGPGLIGWFFRPVESKGMNDGPY
jgi:hypothetical protein